MKKNFSYILTVALISATTFAGCDKSPKDDDDFIAVTDITGVTTAAEINKPVTLTATVSPTDATNKTIVWTVKDAGSTGITIASGNTLTATAAGTVTVTATIANGLTKNSPFVRDFIISVKPAEEMPTITDVMVAPTTASIAKGGTQTFTATITGTKLEETHKTVNWTVTGGTKAATAITAAGVLTVAEDETAASLTVKATSTVDNNKSGTATVTVTEGNISERGQGLYIGNSLTPVNLSSTPGDTFLEKAMRYINYGANNTTYTLVIGEDISYSGQWGYLSHLDKENVTLTVTSNNRHTISSAANKIIFSVSGSNKLIINGKITLKGTSGEGSHQPIILISNGGTFELGDEAALMGATGRQGVNVSSGGTFTMKDGSIYNNFTLNNGAGVNVRGEGSTFIMEKGKIFGNTASSSSSYGGGVCLWENSTFIMKGGAIYGNKAHYGGGVGISHQGGGAFIMEGGTILGNSDGFIDGELVPKMMRFQAFHFTDRRGWVLLNMEMEQFFLLLQVMLH